MPRSIAARASGDVGRRRRGDDQGVEVGLLDHRHRLGERAAAPVEAAAAASASATGSAIATSRQSLREDEDAQMVAAHRPEAREADPEGRAGGPRRRHRVTVSAGAPAAAATAGVRTSTERRTDSITVVCSSSVSPGYIGSESVRSAARR